MSLQGQQCTTSQKWAFTIPATPPPTSSKPSGSYYIRYVNNSLYWIIWNSSLKQAVVWLWAFQTNPPGPEIVWNYDDSAKVLSFVSPDDNTVYYVNSSSTCPGAVQLTTTQPKNPTTILGSDGSMYDAVCKLCYTLHLPATGTATFLNSTFTGINVDKNWGTLMVPPIPNKGPTNIIISWNNAGYLGPDSMSSDASPVVKPSSVGVGTVWMWDAQQRLSTLVGFGSSKVTMYLTNTLAKFPPVYTFTQDANSASIFLVANNGGLWDSAAMTYVSVDGNGKLIAVDYSNSSWNAWSYSTPTPPTPFTPQTPGNYVVKFGDQCLNAQGKLETCGATPTVWKYVQSDTANNLFQLQLSSDTSQCLINPSTNIYNPTSLTVGPCNTNTASTNFVAAQEGYLRDQNYGYCVGESATSLKQFFQSASKKSRIVFLVTIIFAVLTLAITIGLSLKKKKRMKH